MKRWENRARTLLPALAICAAVVAAYAPSIGHGFITVDDSDYVTANPWVRQGLTLGGVRWAFTTFHASNWHPLTWISHMLDVTLFGMNPSGHHAVNLLLHTANALLLYRVVRVFTGAEVEGTLIALLFALHPLRVQSVVWVAERKDLLAACLWLLVLLSYRRYAAERSPWGYTRTLLLFAAGLMAKPMLVTLPAILLLLDFWPLGRGRFGPGVAVRTSWVRLVAEKAPFFALAALSAAVTVAAQAAGKSLVAIPVATRIANAATSYVKYLETTLWPSGLSIFYPYPKVLPPWQTAAAFLALLGATALALALRRRKPWLLVGWAWYLIALLPVIGLIQVGGQARADRYTYLPSVGILVAVVWFARDAWKRRPAVRVWAIGACLLAAAALACATVHEEQHWRDTEALMTRALVVDRENAPAHNNLGNILVGQGRMAEARGHFEEAIRIQPGWASPRSNLAALLAATGRPLEAIARYREASDINPDEPKIRYNLALTLQREGRPEEAEAEYRRALSLDPEDPLVRNNLGALLADRGAYDEALANFHEAIRSDPAFVSAILNSGLALEKLGDRAGAGAAYRTVLSLQPENGQASSGLARCAP